MGVPGITAMVAVLVLAAGGTAQAKDGIDPFVVKPAMDSSGGALVDGAAVNSKGGFSLRTSVMYLSTPLRLTLGGSEEAAIRWALIGSLDLAVGLSDDVEVTGQFLVTRKQRADGSRLDAAQQAEELGLLDPRLQIKWRLSGKQAPAQAALALIATAPLGEESALLGDSGPTFEPRAILEKTIGPVALAANLGVRLRQETLLTDPTTPPNATLTPIILDVGHELTYGASARLGSGNAGVAVDVSGLSPLTGTTRDRSLHLLGSLWFSPNPDVRVMAGAGSELLRTASRRETAIGLLSIAWSPGGRFAEEADRDHDGIADALDKCPDEAEDQDGFEDDDGCPDLDNDGDGVPDLQDRCPDQAEDRDGFEDDDGCPDLDNDKDGVPDAQDKCPSEAEDMDGFQDEDGCPELDNDGDGIPDAQDRCPNEPEDFNGIDDDDGCPDSGRRVNGSNLMSWPATIAFEAGQASLTEAATSTLDRVAQAMREIRAQKGRVRIEGHANAGRDAAKLAQKRAEVVLDYLVKHGVDASLLSAAGYGATRPVVSKGSQVQRRRNDRVELIVVR